MPLLMAMTLKDAESNVVSHKTHFYVLHRRMNDLAHVLNELHSICFAGRAFQDTCCYLL